MNKSVFFLFLSFLILLSTALSGQEIPKGLRIKQIPGNSMKRWAICVGINDYEDSTILDLKKARNDAKALGDVLTYDGQFDRVIVMTDDVDAKHENYPKFKNVRNKLNLLKTFISPDDLVLFSFSGHGISNEMGKGYLVMADSYIDNIYNESLPIEHIADWLKELKVKKSLLIVDACRETFQEAKGINRLGLREEKFEQAEVAATFYATKEGGFSYEDPDGENGVFTKFIIEGLKGKADMSIYSGNEDGIVAFTELAAFVEDAVTRWALDHSKSQKPYTKIRGEKFGDLALTVSSVRSVVSVIEDEETASERIAKPTTSSGKALIVFKSEPSGVEFHIYDSLGGRYDAVTPKSLRLGQGNYRIEAKRSLYYSYEEILRITSSHIKESRKLLHEIKLKPNFGGIKIESYPSGAGVFLHGVQVGITPFQSDEMQSGQYKFEVRKKLFVSEYLEAKIEDEKTDRHHTRLTPDYIKLTIRENDNRSGKLFIDGKSVGKIPYSDRLQYRDYKIEVKPDDFRYSPYFITVTARKRGEEIEKVIAFEGIYGNVVVETDPFLEGDIYIDDRKAGISPDQFDVLIGEHEIVVRGELKGRNVIGRKKIVVRENAEAHVVINLVGNKYYEIIEENKLDTRRQAHAAIESDPEYPGSELVFIDGTRFGELPLHWTALYPGSRTIRIDDFSFSYNFERTQLYAITPYLEIPRITYNDGANILSEWRASKSRPNLLPEEEEVTELELESFNIYAAGLYVLLGGGIGGGSLWLADYLMDRPADYATTTTTSWGSTSTQTNEDEWSNFEVWHYALAITSGCVVGLVVYLLMDADITETMRPIQANIKENNRRLSTWEKEEDSIHRYNEKSLSEWNQKIEEKNKNRNKLIIENVETGRKETITGNH